MNIYTKYIRAVKLVKGLIILDKLYKWLFWIALICSWLYYVFSLSKEFMWHLVLITSSISIIWTIIRMLQLHIMDRLSDIYNSGMENQTFRENIVDMYRKRLKKIDNKLQKKSSKKLELESERENLLYLIKKCILYTTLRTPNYE